MNISLIINVLLLKVNVAVGIKYCYQCSDANIETHYGAFFINPRVLQDRNRNKLTKCDRFNVPLVECDSMCYSLNVTSLHVRDRELLPFGFAHGCSQYVLSGDVGANPSCVTKDILLRTIPRYVVQAEYCMCEDDLCNRVNRVFTIPQRNSPAHQHFFVNYMKNLKKSSYFNNLHCLALILFFTNI
ncbi:hypothetical protein DICVIV_10565 [Dictyocaulus viviparus]|uniref:Protein quiver n=1 Tax=Dictyocaulus viviparus TaxID=29172 RepID=A0A0D8XI31_DICVI|nr:hypothetical protein DICVIV_10565 [Dictyocaulus viviparus]